MGRFVKKDVPTPKPVATKCERWLIHRNDRARVLPAKSRNATCWEFLPGSASPGRPSQPNSRPHSRPPNASRSSTTLTATTIDVFNLNYNQIQRNDLRLARSRCNYNTCRCATSTAVQTIRQVAGVPFGGSPVNLVLS